MVRKVQFNYRKETQYIVVHCSATKPSMDVGVKEITGWHKQRGFLDIGYHKVIRRNGAVEDGRDVDAVGAHVEGYNEVSVGVCLVGGVPEGNPNGFEANFTSAQMDSLKVVLKQLKELYPAAKVIGHHTLNKGKACPSFDVSNWLESGIVRTSDKG